MKHLCLQRYALGVVFLSIIFSRTLVWAVGESAVITLVFPPGARATGLGEAFVAVSDDINATFFNPAGLGLTPLSHAWKSHLADGKYSLSAISAKRTVEFGDEKKIWVGTNKGVLCFNGNTWENYVSYLVVEDDDFEKIIKKFLHTDDENLINNAIKEIKLANSIELRKSSEVNKILRRELTDSVLAKLQQGPSLINELTDNIMNLAKFERTSSKIYGLIANKVDSSRVDTVSEEILKALQIPDIQLEDVFELKIPFSIAVKESVTALVVDESDAVWVGTANGLWQYNGNRWKKYSVADGLPSNRITCLASEQNGRIAVGTANGAAIYNGNQWTTIETQGLTDTVITAVAISETGALYIGTAKGMVVTTDSAFTVYDTSHGLMSNEVTALLYDSDKRIWVGGNNGIAVFDGSSWKRYRFPDSRIYSFAEYNENKIWIGTNKGAIRYKEGKMRFNEKTQKMESVPEWKVFHSKNALTGDSVKSIAVHGDDAWLTTEKGVNQYDHGEKQAQFFYEPILPAFKLPDLWHSYLAISLPTDEWGTFAFSANYLNFGENSMYDELGREVQKFRSFEVVFFFCYGFALSEMTSVGLNTKLVYSALAPGYGSHGEGIGITFAIDAGVLKRALILKNLDVGLLFQNMGPAIYYIDPAFKDPLPFNIKAGLAYHIVNDDVHQLCYLLDFNREIVKNYPDKAPAPFWEALFVALSDDKPKEELQEVIINTGLEYWYARFLALRSGFLFDWVGERYELTFGMGLRYGNINFDWSYIYSPPEFMKKFVQSLDPSKPGSHGARDTQWRASFIFKF